jgi:hypothetical protein
LGFEVVRKHGWRKILEEARADAGEEADGGDVELFGDPVMLVVDSIAQYRSRDVRVKEDHADVDWTAGVAEVDWGRHCGVNYDC